MRERTLQKKLDVQFAHHAQQSEKNEVQIVHKHLERLVAVDRRLALDEANNAFARQSHATQESGSPQ